MDHDVRRDVELLSWFCDQTPAVTDRRTGHRVRLNAKTIALWTGLSLQTVSDYRVRNTNIPIDFWRRLLDHVMDLRIVALLVPDDHAFELTEVRVNAPASGPEFFRQALDLEIKHHEQMVRIVEIIADGQIDELDHARVQAYDDAFLEHRVRDAALHSAICNSFNRALERKGASS